MNPLMVAFVLLGLIYFGLIVWSAVMGFMGSLGISVAGILICFLGWKYARDNLQ